jgi:4-carboxymuconolactone decarboxylase
MTESSPAQRALGVVAPELARVIEKVAFGDVPQYELSNRDRSLITVASLVTSGNMNQLGGHVQLAIEYGLTQAEVTEAISHLAFYVGWSKAMTAIQVAKQAFAD